MRHNTFHEIFQQVSDAPIKADKIAILKKYESPALKAILGYTYDPRVIWQLPKSDPPYNPLDERLDQQSRLAQEVRKLYLFVNGPGPINDTQRNLKPIRREQIFIQVLESVDPNDAKVLLMMKNRKLLYKGLTRNLVAETFPDVVIGWPEEK
jgi:hypothetical protein